VRENMQKGVILGCRNRSNVGMDTVTLVLVIAGEKRFPPPNFNLKIMRIQRGGGSWMLLDALMHYLKGPGGGRLKRVMIVGGP
jgi:hypothetical protein